MDWGAAPLLRCSKAQHGHGSYPGGPHSMLDVPWHKEGWMYGKEPARSFCMKTATEKSIGLLRSFVGNYHILANFSNCSNSENQHYPHFFLHHCIYRSSTSHSYGTEYFKIQVDKLLTYNHFQIFHFYFKNGTLLP